MRSAATYLVFFSEVLPVLFNLCSNYVGKVLTNDRYLNCGEHDCCRISALTFLLAQRVIPTLDIKKF